jgi:hypothetical protein
MENAASAGELVVEELRVWVESDSFPVRGVVGELVRLMGEIEAPLEGADGDGTGERQATSAMDLETLEVKGEDGNVLLRRAVEEAVRVEFGVEAVGAVAEALVAASFGETPSTLPVAGPSVASALEKFFEPLRLCLEEVKRKVDLARGFAELDVVCGRAPLTSALELFGLRWGIFRGTAGPPEVDPFAAAIIGLDLKGLKELIGGKDPSKIEIDPRNLPLDVLRLPGNVEIDRRKVPFDLVHSGRRKKASLISVAAAVGG